MEKNKLKDSEELLQNLLCGIGNIFSLVECENAPVLELLGNTNRWSIDYSWFIKIILGEKADITDHNAMLYLGLIEKRISKIITRLYYEEKTVISIL